MIPEMRNAKGEDIGKFVAEMQALAKKPEMRPFLTATEEARQAKEAERDQAEEERRREAWMLEQDRRYRIIAEWFDKHMKELAPVEWEAYQEAAKTDGQKALRALRKKGWKLHARFAQAGPEGYTPVPTTVCAILNRAFVQKIERLVWAEPQKIPSAIIGA